MDLEVSNNEGTSKWRNTGFLVSNAKMVVGQLAALGKQFFHVLPLSFLFHLFGGFRGALVCYISVFIQACLIDTILHNYGDIYSQNLNRPLFDSLEESCWL